MNLSALLTFQAIVETGSLVKASERLNVTQSTITARLQSLEGELGQALFVRQKSGARLTAAGAKFQRYANAMVSLWGQAQQDAGLPEDVGAVCNIGCEAALWTAIGERAFEIIHAAPTETATTVWPCQGQQVDEWLSAGLIDLAFAHRAATVDGMTTHRLADDQIILVSTNPNAPLRHDPGYVFADNGDAFGRAHHLEFADADTARLSFGMPEWAVAHILRVGGTTYAPERLVRDYLTAGSLHHLKNAPAFTRPVWLTVRESAVGGWPWADELLSALQR